MVWFYSWTHKRLEKLTNENYASLFDYNFMGPRHNSGPVLQEDPSDILNLLTRMRTSNDKIEQILLYADHKFIFIPAAVAAVCSGPVQKHISDELRYLQEHKQIKIVLFCITNNFCYYEFKEYSLCYLSKKWLQRKRLIEIDADKGKSLDIFRLTFELIRSL